MSKNVLIVARSGRQLAEAARAGGYEPIVVDLFGDIDTETACVSNIVLSAGSDLSFNGSELLAAATKIRSRYGSMPLVWASGWEAQPHLLAALAQTWSLIGCGLGTLFAVNDPRTFTQALARTNIPTPNIVCGRVPASGPWLLKRRGSCGGFGVNRTRKCHLSGQREYFQSELTGVHLSAAFIASPRWVSVLGVCDALNLQPSHDFPYRFSAAIAAPRWFDRLRYELDHVAKELTKLFTLRGLCGIDFIVDQSGRLNLIELNPRPTATFDLLAEAGRVFQAHMDPDTQAYGSFLAPQDVRGMAVCYADHPVTVSKTLNWPEWVADRPRIGTSLTAGMPVCSISASAATEIDTRKLLEQRTRDFIGQLNYASERD